MKDGFTAKTRREDCNHGGTENAEQKIADCESRIANCKETDAMGE